MHNFSKIHLLFISVFLYYAGMEFQSDQSVLPDFQSFLSSILFRFFRSSPRPYYRTRMNTSGSYALVPSCLWLSFRTTRLRPRLPLYSVSGRSVPLTGHSFRKNGIACPYAVRSVCVTSADSRLFDFLCKLPCSFIRFC